MTVATRDTVTAAATPTRPLTGAEYLESLRDEREIWLYGKRVADVTTHPAFRIKLLKLLWDAMGTEFGARHELYEINCSGSTEENRLTALNIAQATGLTERMKDLVHACMAAYDINGWTVPDLINPDDVSWLPKP